jgi:DNA-binding PadR family transcriptional regulator
MTKKQTLGEIEHLVLLVVVRLGDEAYGMRISEELAARTGRDVAIGSVYAALDRLEKRGYVASSVGDPTPQRGGRAKRYFTAQRSGVEALAHSQALLTGLWNGIELDPESYA